MTLAIYNCTWTPLTISFDYASNLDTNSDMLRTIDMIMVVIYSVDIVIQFMTSYYNVQTGDQIFEPSKIAFRYMSGLSFWIDILSTVPFRYAYKDVIWYQNAASLLQLLKVFRIRKLYATISQSNLTIEEKAITKIAFYSFLLCVYTHIFGCLMWFFLKTDWLWVAPTDFGNIRSRMQDPW